MITSIDHIELIVRDVAAHVEFYKKLGFKEVRRTSHHKESVELQLPGDNQPVIEFHELLMEENPGINHICLKSTNVQETFENLTSQGIDFYMPPTLSPTTGRMNALFRDPDGWRLQLTDRERGQPKAE